MHDQVGVGELRERIRHLEALIENMGNPMGLYDRNGVLLLMNRSAAAYLGGTPQDYIGRPISDFIPEQSHEYLKRIREAFQTGRPKTYEDLVRLNSRQMRFLSNYIPIFDGTAVYAVQIVSIDITARYRTERALARSAEQFRSLADNLPCVVSRFDRKHRHIFINRRIEEVTGIDASDYIGKTNRQLNMPPDLADLWESAMADVFRSGQNREIRFDYPSETGRKYFESQLVPEYDPNGSISSLLVIARDVTERKHLEDELRAKVELLRLVNSETGMRPLINAVVAFFKSTFQFDAVGIRLQKGRDFPFYAADGFSKRFLKKENSLLGPKNDGRASSQRNGRSGLECMCGRILQGQFDPERPFFTSRGSFWTDSTSRLLSETTPGQRLGRTRNYCHREGYESVALIPLKTGDKPFGLLQLNDRKTGCFGRKRIALLESFADQVAVAVAQRSAEERLRKREKSLRSKTKELEQLNTALNVLLEHTQKEKRRYEEQTIRKAKQLIDPYLEKLQHSRSRVEALEYARILSENIETVLSHFSEKLSGSYAKLTPSEIRVAELVRAGKTSKEIAQMLHLSPRAIYFHRNNIRKKLNIKNKQVNLRTYLSTRV